MIRVMNDVSPSDRPASMSSRKQYNPIVDGGALTHWQVDK